mgnify:CR=1 FL=1|tara:strand:- start:29 stop:703 length:675 start_codon:yes stop_codon:yes gene_type:complete
MKKVFAVLSVLLLFGCTNPSMERGFARLNEEMKDLVAAFDALNIPQMQEDMESIVADLTSIAEGIKAYQDAMIEYNAHIMMYNEALQEYNDAMLSYVDAQIAADEFLASVGEITQSMLGSLTKLREMSEAGNQWAEVMLLLAEIKISLNGVLAQVKTLATKEQVAAINNMLQEMNSDLDWYISIQDFDYDGVMNGLDKCPNTPITEINNVNADGCAPDETPEGS